MTKETKNNRYYLYQTSRSKAEQDYSIVQTYDEISEDFVSKRVQILRNDKVYRKGSTLAWSEKFVIQELTKEQAEFYAETRYFEILLKERFPELFL